VLPAFNCVLWRKLLHVRPALNAFVRSSPSFRLFTRRLQCILKHVERTSRAGRLDDRRAAQNLCIPFFSATYRESAFSRRADVADSELSPPLLSPQPFPRFLFLWAAFAAARQMASSIAARGSPAASIQRGSETTSVFDVGGSGIGAEELNATKRRRDLSHTERFISPCATTPTRPRMRENCFAAPRGALVGVDS